MSHRPAWSSADWIEPTIQTPLTVPATEPLLSVAMYSSYELTSTMTPEETSSL